MESRETAWLCVVAELFIVSREFDVAMVVA